MKRYLALAYSLCCYLLFFIVSSALIGFVGNFGLSRTIDRGPTSPLTLALAINALLIIAFGLQHSLMARQGFKRWWTRYVPQPVERSTYVLASCLATILLMWFWQPIAIVLWDFPAGIVRYAMWGLFISGWLMIPIVSLLINHFDLFGLRQAWLYWRGRPYQPLPFRTPGFYAWVRHPLYIGWALAFWATPTMTVGHLLFAGGMSLYMVIAVQFEERDLVAHFGDEYSDYQRRVGMFVPKALLVTAKEEALS